MRTLSPQPQDGFSLIEALVALVVLSVGLIGIAALYGQGLNVGRTALYRTHAVNLVADMADRIRVNRAAGAAYENAAKDNDCDPGDNKDCSPQEMAEHDLLTWNNQIQELLPAGQGVVDFEAGNPPTYRIRVTWQEAGLGVATHEVAIQVPDL